MGLRLPAALHAAVLEGVLVTLAYTGGTILLGLVIGLLIGLGRLSRSWLVNVPLIAFIEAFRCTPLLVQIVTQIAVPRTTPPKRRRRTRRSRSATSSPTTCS